MAFVVVGRWIELGADFCGLGGPAGMMPRVLSAGHAVEFDAMALDGGKARDRLIENAPSST